MNPLLIESADQMTELLEQLTDVKLIAVDTEFFRETTYYPKLALVQIATDSIVACVDPLAFEARPALRTLLLDVSITKIFHSCSQDLEVLFYYLGEIPNSIYDTQIANALLTEFHQIGYASLVENEIGTQLDKSQTRTNWLQRPLTAKQIQYAGDDVIYLYQLHSYLDKQLQQKNRHTWFTEECGKLSNNENNFQVAIDKLWRRVSGATKLNRSNIAIVQAIAEWRETNAQEKDKTRKKVLADDILLQLATDPPTDTETLQRILTSRYRINDNEQLQLLDVIVAAQQIPEAQWPDNRYTTLEPLQKTLLKSLQQLVSKKAEELGIASAIICSKKDLENLILRHSDNHNLQNLNVMQGWRLHCIGESLITALTKSHETS